MVSMTWTVSELCYLSLVLRGTALLDFMIPFLTLRSHPKYTVEHINWGNFVRWLVAVMLTFNSLPPAIQLHVRLVVLLHLVQNLA